MDELEIFDPNDEVTKAGEFSKSITTFGTYRLLFMISFSSICFGGRSSPWLFSVISIAILGINFDGD